MELRLPKETKVFQALATSLHLVIGGYLMAIVRCLIPSKLLKAKTKDVSGQVVVISGAGSGLGRLMSVEFSKLSSVLVLLDLRKEPLQETTKLLEEGTRVFMYECDVSDRHRVYDVAKKIRSQVGRVDIVVNNAGIVTGARILDIPDEKIERTMKVNALAHFWMCKAFLPDMMASNSGHIVSIASLAGVNGLPNLTDYCASKFAAVGLMETLRIELDSQGLTDIKLTTVCPSLTSTGLFEGTTPPLTVLMTPEFVVRETVSAVLEEQEFVLLPRWMYLIILLKWTMPGLAVKRFIKNSGLLTFMDSFKGKTSASENNSNPD